MIIKHMSVSHHAFVFKIFIKFNQNLSFEIESLNSPVYHFDGFFFVKYLLKEKHSFGLIKLYWLENYIIQGVPFGCHCHCLLDEKTHQSPYQ